ncbi:hypothetical protein KHS38_11400 [Mucilaginibacter sp. Bleaf8]|uniref:hypothetical protein n=1 Tax=Mucilaginibacter sp. Bleaf8 TaxID=2834430 RepID=UPI001BCFA949|nr:hypothetical protein [Mucilaginibacter sp. Bleaf8]MBS7565010.1 hypothetical protein [Mucilaginibacter sp. Bleaf8]
MSTKNNTNISDQGIDGTKTKHKGESQQSHQKGAPSVSNKTAGKHLKDESGGGSKKNTTKKQQNSI